MLVRFALFEGLALLRRLLGARGQPVPHGARHGARRARRQRRRQGDLLAGRVALGPRGVARRRGFVADARAPRRDGGVARVRVHGVDRRRDELLVSEALARAPEGLSQALFAQLRLHGEARVEQ